MSLINKMLQDLDARGSQAGAAPQAEMYAVPRSTLMPSRRAWLAGGAGLALLACLAAAWYAAHLRAAAPLVPQMSVPAPAATPTLAMPPQPQAKLAAPSLPPQLHANVTAPPVVAASIPERAVVAAPPAAPPRAPRARLVAAAPAPAADKPVRAADARPPAIRVRAADARSPASAAETAPEPRHDTIGQSPQQRAESEYRRALADLETGRVGAAVAALEQTLRIDARHDAARQTLVGLLIEENRQDEALELIRAGLAMQPRQPALAMLLARMEIDRGGNGIATLERSLPGAEGQADYQAMLAAALQRNQRHREAIEHYRAALAVVPGNAVWQMGLGMSLEADKRAAEARDAYRRALAAGTLAPQLGSFVEGRLQQLDK